MKTSDEFIEDHLDELIEKFLFQYLCATGNRDYRIARGVEAVIRATLERSRTVKTKSEILREAEVIYDTYGSHRNGVVCGSLSGLADGLEDDAEHERRTGARRPRARTRWVAPRSGGYRPGGDFTR